MQFIVSGQRIAVENFVTGKLYTILWKNDTQVTLTCISIGADCVVFQGEAPLNLFTLTMQNADTIDTIEPTQLGTTNYNNLINKPSINGVDLIGNKTSSQLGIRDVPAIIETDDGKVLTAAGDGSYSWEEIPEGTTDYTDLSNKPQINDVTLTGNVSLSDLGAAAASDIPTTPGDIGAEPAITSENKLDPALIAYDSSHAAITSAQVSQIGTNENNISNIQTTVASYHKASGTDIFFQEVEPIGEFASGSYWISTTGNKICSRTDNLINYPVYITDMQPTVPVSTASYYEYTLKPNTAYTLSSNYYGGNSACWFITAPNDTISSATNGVTQSNTSRTYTTDSTGKLWIWGRTTASGTAGKVVDMQSTDWVMLNEGDTAVEYAPYYDWS